MAATVPDVEPTELTAGDTATWTRTLDDYPAPTWALSYAFLPEGGTGQVITITAGASGSAFLVNVVPANTVAWGAGIYAGQGYVTNSGTGERYNIWEGTLLIKPNFVGAGEIDPRSKAKRIVDSLEDIHAKWASKQTSAATIEGMAFTFKNFDQLKDALNYWKTTYAREQGHARRIIFTRFRAPAQWPPLIIPGQTGWP